MQYTLLSRALGLCMQDTFARATHSAGRPSAARDDRISCIQAWPDSCLGVKLSQKHASKGVLHATFALSFEGIQPLKIDHEERIACNNNILYWMQDVFTRPNCMAFVQFRPSAYKLLSRTKPECWISPQKTSNTFSCVRRRAPHCDSAAHFVRGRAHSVGQSIPWIKRMMINHSTLFISINYCLTSAMVQMEKLLLIILAASVMNMATCVVTWGNIGTPVTLCTLGPMVYEV